MFPSIGKSHKIPRSRSPHAVAVSTDSPKPALSAGAAISCFAQYLSMDDRLVSRLDDAAGAPDLPRVSLLSEASVIVSQAHRLRLQTARFGLPTGADVSFAPTGAIRLREALERHRNQWEIHRCVVPMNAFMAVTPAARLWWSTEDSIVYAAALCHAAGQNDRNTMYFQLIQSPLPDRPHAPAFLPGAMIGWWLSLAGSDAADYLIAAPQPELERPQPRWSPPQHENDARGLPLLATGTSGGSIKPQH